MMRMLQQGQVQDSGNKWGLITPLLPVWFIVAGIGEREAAVGDVGIKVVGGWVVGASILMTLFGSKMIG